MKKISVILICAVLTANLYGQRSIVLQQIKAVTKADTVCYLGYGQSNREGNGLYRPGIDTNTNTQVLELSRGRFKGVNGEFVVMDYPLEFIGNSATSMGMDVYLANQVQEATGRPIVASYTARGGTAIADFLPEPDQFGLYADITSRNSNLNDFPRREIEFFTWHQGETDASNPSQYLTRLALLVDSLNARFGDIPWFIGEPIFAYGNQIPSANNINKKLRAAPDSIDNLYFIPSAGIFGCGDAFHFDAPSYEKLAKRYAAKINDVVYRKRVAPERPVINLYFTGTTSAIVDYDYIYSTLPIERVELYVADTLFTYQRFPEQDDNGNFFEVSGVDLDGVDIYIRAKNAIGWSHSDTITKTYNSSVPSPDYQWYCNETSGLTLADAGPSGNDATLSVDASTVTTTLLDSNALEFSGSQQAALSTPVTLEDTFTVAYTVDPGANTTFFLGNASTGIAPALTKTKFGLYWQQDVIQFPAIFNLQSAHQATIVIYGRRARFYVNGEYQGEAAVVNGANPAQYITISELGKGIGIFYTGSFRNIRIWQGVALDPNQINQLTV